VPLNPAPDGSLSINIRRVIEFFDFDDRSAKHASSIKGILGEEFAVACMKRYFSENQCDAELLMDAAGQNRLACTSLTKPGYHLDGWLRVKDSKQGIVFYQTEIKSWSFHGYASKDRRLPIDEPQAGDLRTVKANTLKWYLRRLNGEVAHDDNRTRKVLLRMNRPKGFESQITQPRALLCIWEAVCDEKDGPGLALFDLPVSVVSTVSDGREKTCEAAGFSTVTIFSVSNYLRAKIIAGAHDADGRLRLHMPHVAARLRTLSNLFAPDGQ
jgi:hypothetical protein